MANIKCNGKVEAQTVEAINMETQNINTQVIDVQGVFSALRNIGGGFEISDAINVGIELGRRDGTPGTPYIDFHTDGQNETDYNVRMIANGSQLEFVAESGIKINGNIADSIVEQGEGYIRYANGIQVCWGKETDTTNRNGQKTYTVNFRPFINTEYTILATPQCTRTDNPYMYVMINIKSATLTTSSAQIYLAPTNSSSWHNGCFWFVIGKWK